MASLLFDLHLSVGQLRHDARRNQMLPQKSVRGGKKTTTIRLKKYCSKVLINIRHNAGQSALIAASEGTPADTKELAGAKFNRNLIITRRKTKCVI